MLILKRTNVFRLKPSKEQEKKLFELCKLSVSLWNSINFKRRQAWINKSFTWDVSDLIEQFSKKLGISITWRIIKKNNLAWKSYFALRKKLKREDNPDFMTKVSMPRYWKAKENWKKILRTELDRRDYSIVFGSKPDQSFILINWPPNSANPTKIPIRGKIHWNGFYGKLEIVYDYLSKRWYAYQFVAINTTQSKNNRNMNKIRRAYVDLGIINIITFWVEGDSKVIALSGKPLLSDWWHWSGKISKYQSKLAKHGLRTSKTLLLLYRKRQRCFRQAINTIIHKFIQYCYKNDVHEIIVGDIHNIRNETISKSKKINALISNFWNYDYIINRLKTTAENYDITVKFISERGTSSQCIRCGSHNIFRKGRLTKCLDCGLEAHRDVTGVLNIAKRHNATINKIIAHPIVIS